ncbi:MAG: Fe-S cluster assembly protein SufD [Flavobacteriales bacterium]|nr:Fe-S cluster assembly protein SufD [Flavobacteriales bacterium]
METSTQVSQVSIFVDAFRDQPSALSAHHAVTVAQAREAALAMSFPTTRHEAWKYTRTTRIANTTWKCVPGNADPSLTLPVIPGLETSGNLVFVNGYYQAHLSTVASGKGFEVHNDLPVNDQVQLSGGEDFFRELHTGWCSSVVTVRISENAILDKTIQISHIVTDNNALAQPLVVIEAGAHSQSSLVEIFTQKSNTESSFTHRRLSVSVGKNASCTIDKIQGEGANAFLLNRDEVILESDSRFTINTLTVDGQWVRNDLHITLNGINGEAGLHGLFLPGQSQLVDNHTRVDHRVAHCNSHELYKGLLRGNATGVFNGKVYVHIDAQKTNAYQSNANILLSDDAQMYTKPELEIYADDVKCSHGTTTGQLDEAAMFYLKARGIGEENARRLLTTAFLNDVLEKVNHAPVREYVLNKFAERGLLFTH